MEISQVEEIRLQARKELDDGNMAEALMLYQRVLTLEPEVVDNLVDVGNAYFFNGKMDLAEQAQKEALILQPGFHRALSNLGIYYQNKGLFSESIDFCLQALKTSNEPYGILNTLGNVYSDNKQFEEAKACYEQALLIEPSAFHASYNLAVLYSDLKQWKQALDILLPLPLPLSNELKTLYLKQVIYILEELGEAPQTEVYFKQLLELYPKDIQFCYALYNICRLDNRTDEAFGYLSKCVQLDPNNLKLRYEIISYCKFSLCDDSKLLEIALEAHAHLPTDPTIAHELVWALQGVGQNAAAIDKVTEILIVDPDNLFFRKVLAELYIKNKNWCEALKVIHFLLQNIDLINFDCSFLIASLKANNEPDLAQRFQTRLQGAQ